MGCEHRAIARNLTAGAVLSAFLCSGLTGLAAAQSPPGVQSPPSAQAKPAAAKAKAEAQADAKKNPEAALKAYGAGTRAYESGKMADAVTQLSTALSAGGLPGNQMAKALYYRGAAYRKQGKPAMAISDLTAALWLKGGLNDSDRALAIDARQGAYREAGLGDTAPPVPVQQTAAVAQAAPATAPAPSTLQAAPPPAPVVPAAAAAPAAAPQEPIATLGSVPDAPAPVVRSAPVATALPVDGSFAAVVSPQAAEPVSAPVSAYVSPSVPAPEVAQLSAVPAQDTATVPTANPLAGAGQAVTGFFNNMGSSIGKMFGGGSTDTGNSGAQATLTESSPVMTSSTGPVYANTPETGVVNSGWEQAMVVSPARNNGAAKPAPVTAQAPKAAAGSIRLQVAAVRSREEAERVSAKLKSMPAVQSAAATPAIDEAVIGNMGTFYRVRLGPFANAAEPDKLCASLKPQGYDCLVVAQ